MSRDSSVGRAGDCSGDENPDISRSAVQIRLAGLFKDLFTSLVKCCSVGPILVSDMTITD